MAEAAYATGPALLGAPRLLSSIFSEFFVPCFRAGAKQCASAGPQRDPQKTLGPKIYKSGAPKNGPQTFFFSVFNSGPEEPKVPRNIGPQNLKIEAPKSGAPKSGAPKSGAQTVFFFVSFQRGVIQTARGPKVSKALKSEDTKYKNARPQSLKK